MKNYIKDGFMKVANWLKILLTSRCDKAAAAGICDFSGQGRDKYGK